MRGCLEIIQFLILREGDAQEDSLLFSQVGMYLAASSGTLGNGEQQASCCLPERKEETRSRGRQGKKGPEPTR